jgi:hypothetical protein
MDDNNASLAALAALRAKKTGLLDEKAIKDVKVNPDVSAKIAEAYSQLQHTPDDAKTQKAYRSLVDEVSQQYQDLLDQGLKVSKMGEGMDNPYKSSADIVNDVKSNKHLWYYPTEQGFGTGPQTSQHPMLEATKHLDVDGKPMLANDLFRVVHDYHGHAKEGHKLGATGEERAYLEHKKMLSKDAQKALTTETRGQNSWVNYGPEGVNNRKNPANTVFAEQKAGLLPDWAMKDVDELANPLKYNAMKAGRMAVKVGLPALAIGAASASDSADQALMDTIIPGGVDTVGDPLEDRQIMAEVEARKNYDNSPAGQAKKQALQSLIAKK